MEFKRLCGVTPATFEQMVKVVAAEKVLAKKSGRPSKLSVEDQVLMTLEYWREYRTYFHKKFNKQLAKERIVVEHIHRRLKIFRILSSRYRNRRRRFGLRINLIAGVYNYELYLSSQQAIA